MKRKEPTMFVKILLEWPEYKSERHLKRLVKFLRYRIDNPPNTKNVHRHHIIPRSWSDQYANDPNNAVFLTPREHLFAHYMMVRAFPQNTKMAYALSRMLSYDLIFGVNANFRFYTKELRLAYSRLECFHSPETIAKIIESQGKLKSPNKGKRAYNDGTKTKFFRDGEQPDGWVLGSTTDYSDRQSNKSELALLKTSMLASARLKERISNGDSPVNKSGNDNPLRGLRRYHDPTTLQNITTRECVDGLVRGYHIPNENERRKKISDSLSGKEHPWQDKINKNPEKIRKTAEFHMGRKRSEETKAKQREARRKYFNDGGVQHNSGKKAIYNPDTLESGYLSPEEPLPAGWVFGNLGTKKFWFVSPDGKEGKFTIKKAPPDWIRK